MRGKVRARESAAVGIFQPRFRSPLATIFPRHDSQCGDLTTPVRRVLATNIHFKRISFCNMRRQCLQIDICKIVKKETQKRK
jgi:hypothetical protein